MNFFSISSPPVYAQAMLLTLFLFSGLVAITDHERTGVVAAENPGLLYDVNIAQ